MAINRAPWTALVDDDGSNTLGTPWNKAAIKSVILDPADAAYAAPPVWIAVPFVASNFYASDGGMIWTVGAAAVISNMYCVIGKLLVWNLYIAWFAGASTLSGTPGNKLRVKMPGGYVASGRQILAAGYTGGVQGMAPVGGLYVEPLEGVNEITILKANQTAYLLNDQPGIVITMPIQIG